MPNIKIENLSFAYKSKRHKKIKINVFDNLNINFDNASFNVILGESGSGKTTLLKCIAGTLKYDGNILFSNENINDIPTKYREISYIDQSLVLYPHLTIFENIAFPLKNQKIKNEKITELVYDIAKKLKIYDCLMVLPKYISIGQKQRACLAKALIKKSKIYLFDEPISNIDEKERVEIKLIIKEFVTRNKATAIYVTHSIQEALSLGDKIFILEKGKVELSGSPEKVYKSNNKLIVSFKKNDEKR